ncbi:nucleoredoxin-like protein 2 [Ixodes scapularis]|uniref:nucleoredoxin-like protein 2 n=1 Tax=Ixodes scapularis TaxID=6945 RepID=UPI001C37F7EA|nr:nucleoredoxin-like protein 2 [Ixodes scapularis]
MALTVTSGIPTQAIECIVHMAELFKGKVLLKKDGTTIPADLALKGKKIICIYFAAAWCPPCRMFTPVLADAYTEAREGNQPIEVVFVSSDRSSTDMMNYMKSHHGEWLCLPYGDSLQVLLKDRFKVAGIPSLVVCKADATVISANGRPDIQSKGPQAFRDWLSAL